MFSIKPIIDYSQPISIIDEQIKKYKRPKYYNDADDRERVSKLSIITKV